MHKLTIKMHPWSPDWIKPNRCKSTKTNGKTASLFLYPMYILKIRVAQSINSSSISKWAHGGEVLLYLQKTAWLKSYQSGHEFLATGIIMYFLAPDWTEAHSTLRTCIIGSEPANSAEMPAAGRAWRSHCCPQIGWNMRRQSFQVRLFS